ncbi:MAG TPA: type 3 dihydrofolate reductase [Gammaproteobacteria bacterium]|nr:type 3 dihydrofolate reductase [Gammaproteobacteria bacterium]
MKISLIAAMADNGVIGIENRLPWSLSGDMKWFRENTLGKPVVMGRKTFDSIGKALPGRTNIVVTRRSDFEADHCLVVNDIETALSAVGDAEEVMVIGGASCYEQTLPLADRLYLTLVHAQVEGDTWFPEVDFTQWREKERKDYSADDKNQYDYSVVVYERLR